MCWWEMKNYKYTTKSQTSILNFDTPPDSKITNHRYSFKLSTLWKRVYHFYPLTKILDPSKQRFNQKYVIKFFIL